MKQSLPLLLQHNNIQHGEQAHTNKEMKRDKKLELTSQGWRGMMKNWQKRKVEVVEQDFKASKEMKDLARNLKIDCLE